MRKTAGWLRARPHNVRQVFTARLRANEAEVREQERRRLHRDLHDDLGPTLAGIRLRLGTASARLDDQPELRRLLDDAASETARAMSEIRRIVDELPPPELAGLGLPGALRKLAARLDNAGARVTVEAQPLDLAATTELAAYRIAAEGVTNVLRHSGAHHVEISLTADEHRLVLTVADDGEGPPPAGWWGHGTGLRSMRQRAEDVGGSCVILFRPDGAPGTVVRAELPRNPA
ncbi:sensor histidine kinase [Amycolatopsis magusensis]|uniref:sensor histidine kinase n=1 Tax=Amycolatopsis magusensis TaxID=882444 RepID=UPI0024A950F6|nr:sensor histidine kinase [Amycolatopsis magusensis]MDI5981074.1 sensor histidine kinase [Amycolatopsis magusensis]